jgi:hypothetical protein
VTEFQVGELAFQPLLVDEQAGGVAAGDFPFAVTAAPSPQ